MGTRVSEGWLGFSLAISLLLSDLPATSGVVGERSGARGGAIFGLAKQIVTTLTPTLSTRQEYIVPMMVLMYIHVSTQFTLFVLRC